MHHLNLLKKNYRGTIQFMVTTRGVSRCHTRDESEEFIAHSHTSERSIPALKPRADVTKSSKQPGGYEWPHKKVLCFPNISFFFQQ